MRTVPQAGCLKGAVSRPDRTGAEFMVLYHSSGTELQAARRVSAHTGCVRELQAEEHAADGQAAVYQVQQVQQRQRRRRQGQRQAATRPAAGPASAGVHMSVCFHRFHRSTFGCETDRAGSLSAASKHAHAKGHWHGVLATGYSPLLAGLQARPESPRTPTAAERKPPAAQD